MADDNLFPSAQPVNAAEKDIIFEQYKLAVEMWDRVRARRQLSNSFFATLNAAIVAALAVKDADPEFKILLSLAGILIATLWILTIWNYKVLIEGKYSVICRMETLLPSAPFRSELPSHRHFTVAERCIPIAFLMLYAAIAVVKYLQK